MEGSIRDKLLAEFRLILKSNTASCAGASTAANLFDSFYNWSKALNNGKSVEIIYLYKIINKQICFDFSKAFDKVCHSKLLEKLSFACIRGKLLEWFRSYLCRFVIVKVGHSFSTNYRCFSKVPQGTSCPQFFFMCAHDLLDVLKSLIAVNIKAYAAGIKNIRYI